MLLAVYFWKHIPRKRLFGTMRVMAYGLVVSMGLGALTLRSAVADAEDQSMQLGRRLADLSDLLQGANEFKLNGQKIFFSTTMSEEPVKTVLDRFEAHCNKSPAFANTEWKTLGDLKGQPITDPARGMNRLGVIRKDDAGNGDGMVVCFTGDNHPKDLFTALRSFEATGDLHDIGDVRYVHVQKRTKAGILHSTLVQTMWTDGSFNIHAIMGTPGHDTPGTDFVGLPRPIDSTRKITAEALNTPYAARIYDSTASGDAIISDYSKKMESQGWITIASPDLKGQAGDDGRLYTKVETAEQAVLAVKKNGDRTTVVVGSMGVAGNVPKSVTREQNGGLP